jgi:prevent-host-death family protein
VKPVRIQDDIVPVGEFKKHASQILRRLHADARPIVITQRGKATGVLVTPEDFDRLVERERFVAAIHQGLAESDAGLGISNEELREHFDRRYRQAQEK